MFFVWFVFLVFRGRKLHSFHIFIGFILLFVGCLITSLFGLLSWFFLGKSYINSIFS